MSRHQDRITACLLGMAVCLYIAVFTALSVMRYNTFHAATFDLGLTAQVMWNTAYGRVFETSIDRTTNAALIESYLGNQYSLYCFSWPRSIASGPIRVCCWLCKALLWE